MNKLKKIYLLLFIIILCLGIFLRFFEIRQRFDFGHDHDLIAWFVKDVVVNHHPRLIGQETSTQGFNIGPLYYYANIPFFLLNKMDPTSEVWLSSAIGVFGIISSYFIFFKISSKKTGLIASLIYAVSFMVVNNDREAVPTAPVIIWSLWYFYCLHLLLKNKQKNAFILLGVLWGLIWHLNVALVVTTPLVIIALIISQPKKINFKFMSIGFFIFLLFISPFIAFELKHGFIQMKALVRAFSVPEKDIYFGFSKFFRVLYLINKNILDLVFIRTGFLLNYLVGFGLLVGSLVWLYLKKIISRNMAILIFTWLIFYILFFTLFSKPISEYYLNGLFAVYLALFSILLASALENKIAKYFVYGALLVYGVYNIYNIINNYGKQGDYVNKINLIKAIRNDAVAYDFPCVSISYITDFGKDLGYRYLFYFAGLKIKDVNKDIPTYTIIYPLGKDSVKAESTFGFLGLVYPEKKYYDQQKMLKLCAGEDFNLTKPMWGLSR